MATEYIKKEDALEQFYTLYYFPKGSGDKYMNQIEDIHDRIRDLQPADIAEKKRGKWERKLVPVCDDGIIIIPGNVCSECGGITTYNVSLFKYCPNCGSRMVDDGN